MRFVLVTQTFLPEQGGMQFVMASLAAYLQQHGDVLVYADYPYRSKQYRVVATPVLKCLRPLIKRWRLARVLRSTDIVICDSWKSLQALPVFAGKVVVLAHGQEYLVQRDAKKQRILQLMARATHLVASSHATMALVASLLGRLSCKAVVIPPTYGLVRDAVPERSVHTRLQLLSICRLEKRKGLHCVLDCLSRSRQWPDYIWHIIGDGEERAALLQQIADYGLTDRVILHGRVSDEEKWRLLGDADLFVMPSYQVGGSLEGFGIAYVEAARAGVPSIAGQAGGVAEAVAHEQTGWCVDPRDALALQAVLQQAMGDHALRRRYGHQARARFLEVFAADVVQQRFMQHVMS